MPTEGKGKPTKEATLLVCRCRTAQFQEKKRTGTAVIMQCMSCGGTVSVKGGTAPARVDAGEVAFAIEERSVFPEPPAQKEPGEVRERVPASERGMRSPRMLLTEEQDRVISRALEAYRAMHFKAMPELRGQQWMGTALERICADWLAGVPQVVLAIIDALDEQVAAEIAAAEQTQPVTKRRRATIRDEVRGAVLDRIEAARAAGETVTDDGEVLA